MSKTKKIKKQSFGQAIPPISFDSVEILEIIISKNNEGENVVQAMYELVSNTTGMKQSKWITFKQSDFGPLQIKKIDKVYEIVDEKVMAYLDSLQT